MQNQYFCYLIGPSFQGVNRIFVLSFQNNAVRTGNTGNFLPKVKIKDYNVTVNGQKFFHKPVKNDQVDDYTTYFKKYYRMIAIDLSKQQVFDADQNAM